LSQGLSVVGCSCCCSSSVGSIHVT
jgi:hypothetical protein